MIALLLTGTREHVGLATVSVAAALSAHTLGVQLSVYNVMHVGAQKLAWDMSSRYLALAGKLNTIIILAIISTVIILAVITIVVDLD